MSIIIWYIALLFLGCAFFPLTYLVFNRFRDGGWFFSKWIGLLLASALLHALNVIHLVPFVQAGCFGAVFIFLIAEGAVVFWRTKKGRPLPDLRALDLPLIATEEVLLFVISAAAFYVIGFKPEAYGTEKFMDYGFLTAMMRSLWMPFQDMWYAGSAVNYYYGGQYIAAFLIKMTGVSVGVGYNLMRAIITAASFVTPFALAFQLLHDRVREEARFTERFVAPREVIHYAGALLSGCAVAFCGNFHYVIFGIIKPLLVRDGSYSYWFPDTTRYIGFDPDLPDKTSHEFPAYSSVLGDLHAHYIDLLFVLCAVAAAYAYARRILAGSRRAAGSASGTSDGTAKASKGTPSRPLIRNGKVSARELDAAFEEELLSAESQDDELSLKDQVLAFLREVLTPEIILIGVMTGLFRWINFWDFPIYFVVCGSIVFFANLRKYHRSIGYFASLMISQAASCFIIGALAALPFTVYFSQGYGAIGLVHSHTMFYQLVILWGLPVAASLLFIAVLVLEMKTRLDGERALMRQPTHGAEKALAGLSSDDIADAGRYASESSLHDYLARKNRAGREAHTGVDGAGSYGHNRDSAMQENSSHAAASSGMAGAAQLAEAEEAAELYDAASAPRDRVRGRRRSAAPGTSAAAGETHSPLFAPSLQDLVVLLLVLCAMGLVLLPEVIYVKDIYSGDHYRANTMFKLTYQAFILFGLAMGFIFPRLLLKKGRIFRIAGAVGVIALLLTAGYTPQSVSSWFGNVFDGSKRISSDASVFVDAHFDSDFEAISFLNNTLRGQPVILEATGDSYSDYCRVSVATGLPTVLGWYVHEWLWRGDVAALNTRAADIETIYTTDTPGVAQHLCDRYDISYIYVGRLERQKYPLLNDNTLKQLGKVIYSDGDATYIIQLDK